MRTGKAQGGTPNSENGMFRNRENPRCFFFIPHSAFRIPNSNDERF
jgi:hypothetical protein